MDNMNHAENYLRSIEQNVRKIKIAVRGILVFFTFIFALTIVGGIYFYTKGNALVASYYEQFRDSMKETINSISEKLPSKQ